MNIVQLHDRTKFWTDTVASTRFTAEDLDQAINNAINEIVDEKYDHSRLNHKGDSFQRTQRIRDELSNITKELDTDGSLDKTNNANHVLVHTFPSDYKYLLAIAIFVSTTRYNAWPLSYDRKNIIDKNPFRRVQTGAFTKCYYIEKDTGIKIYHPFAEAAPTKIEIAYLAGPTAVFYGYEKGPADVIGLNTAFITALTPTSYKTVEYVSGTAMSTDGVDNAIDYGIAVVDYVNPVINGLLHEEIARRAAMNCLLSSGNIEKVKLLKAETLAT